MSNSYSRRPGEPPPTPSRNFSHPNRQRDPSLSPEHNQDNPPMAPNDSRYMLPVMPSRVFSRSTSNVSLQTERHPHADFDFGYEPPARPGTSHTAISSFPTPDLTATALPQMPSRPAPPVPQIPPQFGGPPHVAINPPSPRRTTRSPPRSPTKSAKSGKNSGWCRFKVKVKKALSFGRKKKLKISGPTDFRHERTYGTHPLRAPGTGVLTAAPRLPVPGGAGGTGVMLSGGLGGGDLGQRPGTSHGVGGGTTGAGLAREVTHGGLGHQDVDGTAVSDDGDSDWEDQEATRVFRAYEES